MGRIYTYTTKVIIAYFKVFINSTSIIVTVLRQIRQQ